MIVILDKCISSYSISVLFAFFNFMKIYFKLKTNLIVGKLNYIL